MSRTDEQTWAKPRGPVGHKTPEDDFFAWKQKNSIELYAESLRYNIIMC